MPQQELSAEQAELDQKYQAILEVASQKVDERRAWLARAEDFLRHPEKSLSSAERRHEAVERGKRMLEVALNELRDLRACTVDEAIALARARQSVAKHLEERAECREASGRAIACLSASPEFRETVGMTKANANELIAAIRDDARAYRRRAKEARRGARHLEPVRNTEATSSVSRDRKGRGVGPRARGAGRPKAKGATRRASARSGDSDPGESGSSKPSDSGRLCRVCHSLIPHRHPETGRKVRADREYCFGDDCKQAMSRANRAGCAVVVPKAKRPPSKVPALRLLSIFDPSYSRDYRSFVGPWGGDVREKLIDYAKGCRCITGPLLYADDPDHCVRCGHDKKGSIGRPFMAVAA